MKQSRRSLSLPEFDYLVVLDFEWTCDDTGALTGGSEIIEFPSVLLRLKPGGITETVAELQLYVRPERNPTLTKFCKDLTGITQAQVDSGLSGLETALGVYREWLVQQQLLPPVALSSSTERSEQSRAGPGWPRFALVTWSDADLGSQLYTECERKGLHHARSWWFRSWINLKPLYAQHYCREARGGLQACVEATGQTFNGRAHSGLVDARNTAEIVVNMREQGFKFVRTTRGCDAQGIPYGRDTNKTGAAASEPSHKRLRTGAVS
jgi:inhibitor of KinA sporulation pathway (predicted exonuclease)